MPVVAFTAVPSIPPLARRLPPYHRSLSASLLNSSAVSRLVAIPQPPLDKQLSDTDTSLYELEQAVRPTRY